MIIKTHISNHKKHKSNLLDLIDSIPNISSDVCEGEQVAKSDWYLNSSYPRKYWDYFFDILNPWFDNMKNTYGSNKVIIDNYWFQQYSKNNYHDWHNHPKCHFSSIYYLELPKTNLVTEFKTHKSISTKEGDIITFPAHLLHRSPVNNSEKRKTVIVFNSNIYVS